MTRITLVLFAVSLSSIIAISYAQAPDTVWTRTYGGADIEIAVSAFEVPGEGYIIGGQSSSFSSPGYDYYLVKTDIHGDTIWTNTFGDAELSEVPQCIQLTSDGGCIMAGYKSDEDDIRDIFIVKTYADGQLDWEMVIGEDTLDEVCSWVEQTIDNGYIITGSYTSNETYGDILIMKLDSTGVVQWDRRYSWWNGDYSNCIQQTDDGGYVITGISASVNPYEDDMFLMKLDSNGDSVWVLTYGGSAGDQGRCVRQIIDEGYIIAGYTMSFGAGLYDVYIVKTDLDGNMEWERTFGGPQFDSGDYVELTDDGSYIISGYTTELGTPDIIAIKLNSDGDSLWVGRYGSEGMEGAGSIQQVSDGGYIIGGSTDSFGADSIDFFLVKLAADNTDVIGDNEEPLYSGVYINHNYPNPFNTMTIIRYSLPEPSDVKIEIFDILGRRVETLADEKQQAGYHQAIWNAREKSSGIYFYRIKTPDHTETRTMLLLR